MPLATHRPLSLALRLRPPSPPCERSPRRRVGTALGACLGSALESRYPIGSLAPPELAREVSRSGPIHELPADLEAVTKQATLSPDALQRASRFTAYATAVTVGGGYQKRERRYCDYVLLDAEGRVLGAYRLEGRC